MYTIIASLQRSKHNNKHPEKRTFVLCKSFCKSRRISCVLYWLWKQFVFKKQL